MSIQLTDISKTYGNQKAVNTISFEAKKGENGMISTNEGWPFDKPYFLILNLAIGGNWGGDIDDTIFPSEMLVDYVRIYQKPTIKN